jgi:hypothetical protein
MVGSGRHKSISYLRHDLGLLSWKLSTASLRGHDKLSFRRIEYYVTCDLTSANKVSRIELVRNLESLVPLGVWDSGETSETICGLCHEVVSINFLCVTSDWALGVAHRQHSVPNNHMNSFSCDKNNYIAAVRPGSRALCLPSTSWILRLPRPAKDRLRDLG